MSKDAIKERITDLRELLKGIITLIIALLSGEAILIYQVLNKKVGLFNIVVILVGLIIFFLVLIYGKFLWNALDDYERRL